MAEFCKNGHEFTEENSLWHKDHGRGRTRRRCKECKNGFRRTGKPSVIEKTVQDTTYKHEDLEDLLRFGASFEEIMERGGFASWGGMVRSLRLRGREDLIAKLWHKKELGGANRPLHLSDPGRKKKHGRRQFRHGDIHDLPKELEELIF